MTTTQLRPVAGQRRPLRRPAAGETVSRSTDAPIYTAMVERWASAGRAVPGRYDHEWTNLVRSPSWPEPHMVKK
ncbi:hypothetical protein [Streptomyces sp. KR80]|uniref:hypothetical protein n=1 Tax=Streptomyces sp. KR80 TaxID=3457426 RepID=UPI003FD00C12